MPAAERLRWLPASCDGRRDWVRLTAVVKSALAQREERLMVHREPSAGQRAMQVDARHDYAACRSSQATEASIAPIAASRSLTST